MSKRSSRSLNTIKLAGQKTLGRVGRHLPKKKKQTGLSLIIADNRQTETLKKLNIEVHYEFNDLDFSELILLLREKISHLKMLSPNLKPHKLKLDKKSKEDLIRLITICQNKIISLTVQKSSDRITPPTYNNAPQ